MMILQILGIGCQRCLDLKANLMEAIKHLAHLPIHIEEITEIDKILTYNINTTPALLLHGIVILQGEVLNTFDLTELIKREFEKHEEKQKTEVIPQPQQKI